MTGPDEHVLRYNRHYERAGLLVTGFNGGNLIGIVFWCEGVLQYRETGYEL